MDVSTEIVAKKEDVDDRDNNIKNQSVVNQKGGNEEQLKKDRILKIPKKRERTNEHIDVQVQEDGNEQSWKRKKIDDLNTGESTGDENQAFADKDDIREEVVHSDKKENVQLMEKIEDVDQKIVEEKKSCEGSEKQGSIKNQKDLFQDIENQGDKNQACDNDEKTLNQEEEHQANEVCEKQLCDVKENQMCEKFGNQSLTYESVTIKEDKNNKEEIIKDKKKEIEDEELHIYKKNKTEASVKSEGSEKCDNNEKLVLEDKKEEICEAKETAACRDDKSQLSKDETKSKDNVKHAYSDREKHACLVKEKRIIRRFKDYNSKQMWSERFQDQMAYVNCIITDIEGTTTSISFVKDVIYKYIDNVFPAYIREHWDDEELANDVKDIIELSKEYEAENIPGYIPIPEKKSNPTPEEEAKFQAAFLANYNWQMENRPKSRYMKKLQGHLVADGYRNHEVVGHVYDDVKVAFKLWKKNKLKVCTFSNGSIYAQHLLFHYSRCGNMEDYIDVYFDTTIGEKNDPSSYSFICSAIKENPEDVLFLTDLLSEACAAKEAGLKVLLVQRETANLSDDDKQLLCHTDGIISSFSDIICPPDM